MLGLLAITRASAGPLIIVVQPPGLSRPTYRVREHGEEHGVSGRLVL